MCVSGGGGGGGGGRLNKLYLPSLRSSYIHGRLSVCLFVGRITQILLLRSLWRKIISQKVGPWSNLDPIKI